VVVSINTQGINKADHKQVKRYSASSRKNQKKYFHTMVCKGCGASEWKIEYLLSNKS